MRKDQVEILERPGYFGSRRLMLQQQFDEKYGQGCWAECWEYGEDILSFESAVLLYDLSYLRFFESNIWLAELIAEEYLECYDNDVSNINCGLHHDSYSVPRHIQDVSVRRALAQLGLAFNLQKTQFLQIHGHNSNGYALSSVVVPFVSTNAILRCGPAEKWVRSNSVEDFWQRNKVIVKIE